ncbi:permease-like cell division protein FtsX [Clostridium oryzae]|uniref:Cell division protein FtsX n=1 Tax=Clostridium oryzae TaxID=1450648 RepID=A0A1V4IYT4_9CLOT|nr:permease-like cell division protein FtsX [Clostridium oryzae]OPJ65106.1 cell division protein FtsX [Clostridium oryzae]
MKISTVNYFIVDAFKSFKRNLTISIASIATVAVTLFVFGVFLLLIQNANLLMGNIQSQVEIKVFLTKNVDSATQQNIEDTLNATEGVKSVTFESKEQALENFKKTLGKDSDILNGYNSNNNPIPASYKVGLKDPKYASKVADSIKKVKGVDTVANDRNLVKTIIKISKAVKWVGVGIFILLLGVSLFLIVNTIRLTVYSRRREVGIMKFVGATDWFIRWPFIIEGMIIGIIGAVVSDIVLFFGYKVLYQNVKSFMFTMPLVQPSYVLNPISFLFLVTGAIIGGIGSIIALRKFLAV